MKKYLVLSAFLLVLVTLTSGVALAEQQPEMIAEKMAIKLTRGIANTFTSIVELPKQTILTGRDMGAVGYIVGPIKGAGMTLYRGIIGMVEIIFCMVPQPGYYDPMMDPEFVWQGWEPKRDTTLAADEDDA
jgi:putative exosortase-associated protein (TIGR04073 family)